MNYDPIKNAFTGFEIHFQACFFRMKRQHEQNDLKFCNTECGLIFYDLILSYDLPIYLHRYSSLQK